MVPESSGECSSLVASCALSRSALAAASAAASSDAPPPGATHETHGICVRGVSSYYSKKHILRKETRGPPRMPRDAVVDRAT